MDQENYRKANLVNKPKVNTDRKEASSYFNVFKG